MLAHPDGLSLPQRYWAILTVALGIVMAVMDGAIANVALPMIATDLHASPASSIWIVNGYQLAVTISLLPLASLGEIIGYRRVYLCGLALFTVASLFCALAHTLSLLTLARAAQGFGVAGIMSVNTALVRFIYPHRLLGRGIGINALVVAVSAAVGPTLAAGILAFGHWPMLFIINIPFGIAAFIVGTRFLPYSSPGSHEFDWQSALMAALTVALAIAAMDGLGHSAAAALWLRELAVAGAVGYFLVRRQRGLRSPLLPIDLLRIPIFKLSVLSSLASFCAQMLAFTSLPFFLHYYLGYPVVTVGLLITPWPIAIAIAAPIAGRLVDRYPAGLLGGIGLVLFAVGLCSLALLPLHSSIVDVSLRMALCGVGFGLFQSPNNRTLMAAAPRERSGGASGMLASSRLLGQTAGTTLVAFLLARFPARGSEISLFVGAAFALLGAGFSG